MRWMYTEVRDTEGYVIRKRSLVNKRAMYRLSANETVIQSLIA